MTIEITASATDTLPHVTARWRLVGAIAVLMIVATGTLWLARKPLAEHFVDNALSARGVPAQYHVERIGLRTQRLTHVRVGDPRHPDLIADWIEVDTGLWTSGFTITALRTGHLRLRARLAHGTVTFGSIDRLLPTATGAPFALPNIHAEIGDARIALATAQGDIALTVQGKGQLDNGFAGTVGARAAIFDTGACRVEGATATLHIRVTSSRPRLVGPVVVQRSRCGGIAATDARANVSIAFNPQLDHFDAEARLSIGALAGNGAWLRTVSGPVSVIGSAADMAGTADLRAGPFFATGITGTGAALTGRYRYAAAGLAFDGRVKASRIALPAQMLARLDPLRSVAATTPIGPLLAQAVDAVAAAGRSADVTADFSTIIDKGRGQVIVSQAGVATASGAHARLTGGSGLTYQWPVAGLRVDTDAVIGGGGLPRAQLHLAQASPGGAVIGRAIVAPYFADGAQLILAPIDFSASARGMSRLTTHAVLSGPLANGRIEGLSIPLVASWKGASRLTVNPGCTPVAFDRLRAAGLDMPHSAVTLCPRDGGLLRLAQGAVHGGGVIGPIRLNGMLGTAPLALTMHHAEWRLDAARFAIAGLGVRLGSPKQLTRVDFASLAGTFSAGGVSGIFAGAAGQIGAVPLLLSGAAGQWRAASNHLAVDGTLTVADAAADPRFKPLAARGVSLRLTNSRLTATGSLLEPAHAIKVADVTIMHDLAAGVGHADIDVPGLAFDSHFQPDQLTPLTYGVIADVIGSVSGDGHIRWTPRGLSSEGVFRSAGIDLAAAFGPATGIAGEVHFTDLLALQTAPGQVVTIKTLNPGIAVNDGTVRYHLLPNARVAVELGRWPFAGGSLTLEPTLLDFDKAQQRRMTFRVAGMQAAQFLQQFDFKNLDATGVFDGALPMVFNAGGGRIEGGHLIVQPGGGTLAYVGDITQKNVGFWGNFAFQSLKSLRYRNLEIVMNGPLAGEMITEVRFAGIGQGAGAKRNILFDRLQKLPLVFNVKIAAPFRQLIDSAQSFYDPKRLVERNLPALLQEQNKHSAPQPARPTPIQPSDSRVVP